MNTTWTIIYAFDPEFGTDDETECISMGIFLRVVVGDSTIKLASIAYDRYRHAKSGAMNVVTVKTVDILV